MLRKVSILFCLSASTEDAKYKNNKNNKNNTDELPQFNVIRNWNFDDFMDVKSSHLCQHQIGRKNWEHCELAEVDGLFFCNFLPPYSIEKNDLLRSEDLGLVWP